MQKHCTGTTCVDKTITLNRKCKHIIARNCDFKLLQPKSLALELQRTYEGKQLS